ncbi:MAG: alpha/beta hydrolase [Nocardiopsis sp. BM-2018]|nr:MAG: alpha/beta hydrolase [Nocardiopsis sp. BM-2018]
MEQRWVSAVSPTATRASHGTHPCQGLYHHPPDTPPRIAFIATHYEVDFAEHYLAAPLAARGFGFLGWNTRFRGNGTYFLLEHALVDIAVGVRWLRDEAGVETVVLLGNSGGGSLMAAYQSQAADPWISASHGLRLPEAVGSLAPGDLYVSVNAHAGRPEVLTAWLDPSVTDESEPLSCDPDLDLFDERRDVPLDPAFVDRYRAAQVARNHRITESAIDDLDRLTAAGVGDRVITVHRAWADPRFVDTTIDPSDRVPGCYAGDPRRANAGPFGLARTTTLRSWLSMWSLRTSSCRGAPALARITCPSLVVQSMGDRGVFPSDAREIHAALGSDDTELHLVSGEHYFEDTGPEAVADLIADWTRLRAGRSPKV